jgi:hypothetical protein
MKSNVPLMGYSGWRNPALLCHFLLISEKNRVFSGISICSTMKKISPTQYHMTSVSLPQVAYRRLTAARRIFARHGVIYSDQEIYRRLFKHYLKNWRGRGRKTNGLRRYNCDGKSYEVHALYINQMLHAALWQRATHSGESVSRMLDVAIRVYLPRLLEEILRYSSSIRNGAYWAARYLRRKDQYPEFFINYQCRTERNDSKGLKYLQKVVILSNAELLSGAFRP